MRVGVWGREGVGVWACGVWGVGCGVWGVGVRVWLRMQGVVEGVFCDGLGVV